MARAGLPVLLASILSAPVQAAQPDERWRLSQDGGDIKLYVTDTDEANDHIGSPSFQCDRASGRIRVDTLAGDEEREELITLLRSDSHPIIKIGPGENDSVVLDSIIYSGLDGWHYQFEMQADAPAFAEFRKTGVFQHEIGKSRVRSGVVPGLETVGRFQDLCLAR